MLPAHRPSLPTVACGVRRAIKQQRDALATGELTVAEVMLEQPAALGARTLFEIC